MSDLYDVECLICRSEMKDWDPKICCNGYMCGCLGKPTEPQVCSDECFEKAYGDKKNDETKESV